MLQLRFFFKDALKCLCKCFQSLYGMPSIPVAVLFLQVKRVVWVCSVVIRVWRGESGSLNFWCGGIAERELCMACCLPGEDMGTRT